MSDTNDAPKPADAADKGDDQKDQKKFVSTIIEFLKAGIANITTLKVSGASSLAGGATITGNASVSGTLTAGSLVGPVSSPPWLPYPAGTYTFPSGTKTVAAGVLPIGAVTTAPTFGNGSSLTGQYRNWGKTIDILPLIIQSTTTGAAAGSGLYLIPMPLGTLIDTTLLPIGTNVTAGCVGNMPILSSGGNVSNGVGRLYVYSSSLMAVYLGFVNSVGGAVAGDWSTGILQFTPASTANLNIGGIVCGIPIQ
jgi:hypothetical protein